MPGNLRAFRCVPFYILCASILAAIQTTRGRISAQQMMKVVRTIVYDRREEQENKQKATKTIYYNNKTINIITFELIIQGSCWD